MTNSEIGGFTHSHEVLGDGTVTFKCSRDEAAWPWLALAPYDPIVVQTINYWASVETGAARGSFDTTKWSALTHVTWVCGPPGAGHATHGLAEGLRDEDPMQFRLIFFDANGTLVYQIIGTGVVFKTRDFKDWRKTSKKATAASEDTPDFAFAPPEQLGVTRASEGFLSELQPGSAPMALALITRETGLIPGHRYHSGSGDHVNANHLADACRQFVSLNRAGAPFVVTGGEMRFMHYVELGRVFEVAEVAATDTEVSMIVRQGGRDCSAATFKLQPDWG
jgi:hypothetical protein